MPGGLRILRLGSSAVTQLSVAATVEATSSLILEIGTAWMTDPATAAAGEPYGVPGRAFWACGRGGVLGAVDADVVAAAFAWVEPSQLRSLWEARSAGVLPHEVAEGYLEAAVAWAQGRWSAANPATLELAGELSERVADAASPVIGALFAGWRAMPVPAHDPAGRAVRALHVLREHRGGAHIAAVVASGLSPTESIIAAPGGRGGPERAARFGWAEPFPDASAVQAKRDAAEASTNRIVAPAYETLTEEECALFAEAVAELHRLATT